MVEDIVLLVTAPHQLVMAVVILLQQHPQAADIHPQPDLRLSAMHLHHQVVIVPEVISSTSAARKLHFSLRQDHTIIQHQLMLCVAAYFSSSHQSYLLARYFISPIMSIN